MHSEQKRSFQSMTPEQKLRIALKLYNTARKFKVAGLRKQHPDWSEAKIVYVTGKVDITNLRRY